MYKGIHRPYQVSMKNETRVDTTETQGKMFKRGTRNEAAATPCGNQYLSHYLTIHARIYWTLRVVSNCIDYSDELSVIQNTGIFWLCL